MVLLLLFVLAWFSGFILFRKARLDYHGQRQIDHSRVSVIIPARNEEGNLPYLLGSLQKQTFRPHEIIVVDDFSSDGTREIARKYGAKVIESIRLPDGWTGKNWALWNGYLQSSGDILVFLDADVRLAPGALEALLQARERSTGAISVVPYHITEKFYEKLSLLTYLLGVFVFTSPFEKNRSRKGLYGSCIVAAREDYEQINGHSSVKSEVLDDMKLGMKFSEAGIPIQNFIGGNLVFFRMYPYGLVNQFLGLSKSAVFGAANTHPATLVLIGAWVLGLLLTGFLMPILMMISHSLFMPILIAYILYAVQICYFLKYTGKYGWVMPILHFLSTLFFVLVIIHSVYQVVFLGRVSWKGRQIDLI
jgi:4,4'-diaponeurosporenoate glycosyltransferase